MCLVNPLRITAIYQHQRAALWCKVVAKYLRNYHKGQGWTSACNIDSVFVIIDHYIDSMIYLHFLQTTKDKLYQVQTSPIYHFVP